MILTRIIVATYPCNKAYRTVISKCIVGTVYAVDAPSTFSYKSNAHVLKEELHASEWRRGVVHGKGTGQATASGQSRRTPVPSTQRPPTTPKAASDMPRSALWIPTQANLAHKMAEPNKPQPAKTCGTGCVGTFTGTSR